MNNLLGNEEAENGVNPNSEDLGKYNNIIVVNWANIDFIFVKI